MMHIYDAPILNFKDAESILLRIAGTDQRLHCLLCLNGIEAKFMGHSLRHRMTGLKSSEKGWAENKFCVMQVSDCQHCATPLYLASNGGIWQLRLNAPMQRMLQIKLPPAHERKTVL
jgi:hypothetical protein